MNGQKIRSHIRKHGGEAAKPASADARCAIDGCAGKPTVHVIKHGKKPEHTGKIYCTNCAKARVVVAPVVPVVEVVEVVAATA